MSCTAPIDIPTSQNVNPISGTFNCVYDANMLSGQSVTLATDLSHLTIPCGASRNNIKVSFYTAGTYIPTEIRIYKPSLHTYNGAHADAEMLIVHSAIQKNSGSDGLIVSVPISIGGGSGTTGLDAIIQAANTLNAGTIALTPSAVINQDVNANDYIPSKKYYVYNGTLPYESCGGNYYYAVFTDPIAVAGPIKNVAASGIAVISSPPLLQKSRGGPNTMAAMSMSNNEEEPALFEIVSPDDCDDDPASGSNISLSVSNNQLNVATLYVLWGLLICFVLWVLWKIWFYVDDSTSVASSVAAEAVQTAAQSAVQAQ
jgi:carbonic anhydrase